MKDENKLIDAIIDLSLEIKGMRKDMNSQLGELNSRVANLEKQQAKTNFAIANLEKQQAKTNFAIGELRLSYMKLDESFNKLDESFNKYAERNDERVNGHDKRILHLENSMDGGKTYLAKEPKAVYKRKKRR